MLELRLNFEGTEFSPATSDLHKDIGELLKIFLEQEILG